MLAPKVYLFINIKKIFFISKFNLYSFWIFPELFRKIFFISSSLLKAQNQLLEFAISKLDPSK
jgi:hypothetical protein